MSYCTQHVIQMVSDKQPSAVDYLKLCTDLGKVNSDFYGHYDPFIFKEGDNCLVDINWNYGFGRDWPEFKEDMINLSEKAKVELKCAWQGEEDNDHGFLRVKDGEVLEEKKLVRNNRKWFNKVYCR